MRSTTEQVAGAGDPSAVPTGNTFDKYGSTNPRRPAPDGRVRGHPRRAVHPGRPGTRSLDVGCGEGVLTEQWAQRVGDRRVVGLDLEDPKLAAEWATRARPNLEFVTTAGGKLPVRRRRIRPGGRDRGPRAHSRPGERPSPRWHVWPRGHLLASVPREPLWRMLNIARGAYLRASRQYAGSPQPLVQGGLRAAARPLRRGTRGPLPVPLDDAARAGGLMASRGGAPRATLAPNDERGPGGRARAGAGSYASGARILTIGIASTGIFTFAYLATASHILSPSAYSRISHLLGDHVRDPVGDLPADRTAALADDRRSGGARRDRGPHPPDAGDHPDLIRTALPRRRPGAAPDDRAAPVRLLERPVLDPRDRRARVRRQLLRPRLARRPQAVRPVRRARVPGVDQPLPVRARRGDRHRLRCRRPSPWGWPSPRSCRCA